jgi:hypothetical protein
VYLLDSNIWLERLLNQAHAEDVRKLLESVDAPVLFISDFWFHSLCNILTRTRRIPVLDQFITDLFGESGVTMLGVAAADTRGVTAAMQAQQLDFDDAYQYVISRGDGLTLVSFDSDFDRTDLKRQTPAHVLAALTPPSSGS